MVNHFEEIERMLNNIEQNHDEHYQEILRKLDEIEKKLDWLIEFISLELYTYKYTYRFTASGNESKQ